MLEFIPYSNRVGGFETLIPAADFAAAKKNITLSVKGKNKLYGITVYLLLGLECTSQFGIISTLNY